MAITATKSEYTTPQALQEALPHTYLYFSTFLYLTPTGVSGSRMTSSQRASTALDILYSHPILLALVPFIIIIIFTARSYYRLTHIPGPFFAKFTNIPRFSWVLSYRAQDIHTALHRQYGPLVRFGPNMVSVADPAEVGNIYGFLKPWLKVRCGCYLSWAKIEPPVWRGREHNRRLKEYFEGSVSVVGLNDC